MEDEVYDCFTRLIENRKRPMKEPVIGGHSNIEITSGYYTHARYENAKAELDRLKNCLTETRKSKNVLNFKAGVKTG